MSKQRAIRILNAHGGSFTSRKQAIRFIETGRARYVDERTIEMIEDDYRHLAAGGRNVIEMPAAPENSPSIDRVSTYSPCAVFQIDAHQTFLPYPQTDQRSNRGRLKAA